MNIPIKVLVRIAPATLGQADNKTSTQTINHHAQNQEEDENCLKCAGGRTFRFSHIFHEPISNQDLYFESIAGLKESVLEGYDFSVVTYGARGTGKTFTLYGCMNDNRTATNDGIVLWFVRDLFCRLKAHPERMFSISIAWSEITAEGDVIDVLENAAMVQCFSAEDTYALLGFGLQRRNEENHSILSLVLEQQWTSVGGLNQHRQSTVSFCDLCGTDREMIDGELVPADNGLRKLEDIVIHRNEQYNDSVLTAFLKDSFGGRAQTLLLLCATSSTIAESESTLRDFEFGERAEEIVNHVVMNTFSDNNVPIVSLNEEIGGTNANLDGLYFASQQWAKLLKNAECLFTKLFSTCELNQTERSQIEEWLYLKAECDDCFSSTDISIPAGTQPARACLGPIEEIDEVEDTSNTLHGSGKEHAFPSDNESDSDIGTHLTDVSDRIQGYIKAFQMKTNTLIMEKYQDFFQTHPLAVATAEEQVQNDRPADGTTVGNGAGAGAFHNPARRKSIFDSETVSSTELALMLPLKAESQPAVATAMDKKIDTLSSNLRICQASIESLHAQIEEIRRTIALKQKYITDLIENSETRSVAKSRFSKKKHKLEADYEKAKKQLRKAVVNGTDKEEINRLKSQTSHLEQRLKDLESIGFIAGESGHKKKKLQQSIKDSQKQLDVLQRMLKKELDRKETLERELEAAQKESRVARSNSNNTSAGALQELTTESKSKIRNMNERISHIEHVLKEKSSNLKKYVNKKSSEKESLRCEIRNLRRTRDHLVEQRCQLDRKLREEKMPSFDEERKLVECDEAIEAIDAAIEMKNELICGRRSIDTDESLQREKGEQMLMARLNKLSPDEMRTLLYKYFQKVVDLKEASRKLELQFIALEREKDAWEWQEKILTNTIRQTRLEKERSIVALQKQHETKLNLMLRHFAADTSASISSTIPDNALPPYHTQTAELVLGSGSTRYHHHHTVQYESDGGSSSEPLLAGHTSKQLAHYKAQHSAATVPVSGAGAGTTSALLTHHHHHGIGGTTAPIVVPLVEKDHRPKSKLFSKLQVLSRYHGSDKRKIFQADIPQQNLKQLQGASRPSLTKVTREKNKIIIQSDGGNK
ncbi:kinesin-like protein costa [Anopheles ziemanni]|uniref:kinesin-like protein costa n=1 Tax=Anopheles coustani TaxID=139045 RepID=UPI0026596C50|nr:kinesin-like protein costa [Anopheles coustani]XP_058175212.1 kinesin-like protein costa [Anopheles ziemanni]